MTEKELLEKYEIVVGLEVHAQLNTNTKAYSRDSAELSYEPNSHISPITLGHPGILPNFNKKVLEYAVRLGTALECEIREYNRFARKNYFYADLPKGYQITQDKTPICDGGKIRFKQTDGTVKEINLTRIHMEEDAGKSMHDQDPYDSLIDMNRCGVPLLEIVSEPELRSGEEAYRYLTEVRRILRYLEICDGNMEEGSLRCDANISVRLKGSTEYGERVEVKNLNSFKNVQRAIQHEALKQMKVNEKGGIISRNTVSYNAVTNRTTTLRSKEFANDYRYFPEPDLTPLRVGQDYVKSIQKDMPAMPWELFEKFNTKFGLSDYDAANLTDNKGVALFYSDLAEHTSNYKSAANWVMGPVKSYMNQYSLGIDEFPISTSTIARLIELVDEGLISNAVAIQRIFPELIKTPTAAPKGIAEKLNLIQESDTDFLEKLAMEVLSQFPDKVVEYKNGKKGLMGMFMGQLMKKSQGKANPKEASQILEQLLKN